MICNRKFLFFIIAGVCAFVVLCLFAGCSETDDSTTGLSDYKYLDVDSLQTFAYGDTQSADLTFDTAEALRRSDDGRLTEGTAVHTKGYYTAQDLGGARYIIDKEAAHGAIELQNGLFANFTADRYDKDHCILNVKQFGAKADGVSADQDAINAAISCAGENLHGNKTIVYLPAGEYRADNEILANDLKGAIITGAGDETVIFTDNGYKSWWEFFFACWRDENCFIGNFKIEARESWGQNRYFRQLTLIDCENCYLFNVTLNVPETAWNGEPFARVDSQGQIVESASIDKQYTNMTLYSGDKNITVDGCKLYQMSGTYRGANVGVMDFYQRGTENITIKNCELHDNARDEQVGIFSRSGAEDSVVMGVNFLNNKVFTHPTPYRDLVGGRTMCFTVAYDNGISNINIEGNEFVSYADSKFMSFGSVKNCTVKNNKITVFANNGNVGYVFDSSCANDSDVVIDGNEFYLSYANSPAAGKCVSAGHLTFTNNTVVADCTVYKIADRLGVYEHNDFRMLGSFGSCGSAFKFNCNTVTSYAEHSNPYCEMFFHYTADGAIDENTVLECVGNTITDFTYYRGGKNQRIFDKLGVINSVTVQELIFCGNVYNCPNYSYESIDDYMLICWVRSEATVKRFVCENNDFQGANEIWGAEGGNNVLREFAASDAPACTAVKILCGGKEISELTVSDRKLELNALCEGSPDCAVAFFTDRSLRRSHRRKYARKERGGHGNRVRRCRRRQRGVRNGKDLF